MYSTRQINLSYKDDFRIACKINNLNYADLLQYFIDHVSFYVFIGGNMAAAYLQATMVCIDMMDTIGRRVEEVKDKKIQQISLKYVKMLTKLIHHTNNKEGTAKSKTILKDWSDEMLPLTGYFQEIKLLNDGKLRLSFDFNLLCSMNGISIENQLQYFIDNISLARSRANNLFQLEQADPCNAVLLSLVSSGEGIKDKVLPKQAIYRKYGLRLLKLDKKQKEESNLENRILNYSAFYLDWYHALNKEK